MMQTWKRILSCLMALCLTLALLGGLTRLTQKKDSYAKHAEFFEQDAPFDVFFVGSSRPMNGVFPMELWESFGLVSYNWAQAGHPPPAYYWVMRLALDYQQPKLMVIDCYGMHFDAKTTGVFGLMHISMDSFPLSLTKLRAVRDMLDDPSMTEEFNEGERRSAFNLLWTFPVFHSRWSQLTEEDFRPVKNYTRGAIANGEIFGGEFVRDDSEKGRVFDTVGVQYLRRAIEECQSRGIEVLVTFLPLFGDATQQAAAEYAGQIAAEYGVDYLNFFDPALIDLVNYRVDFADSAGHLNTAGARKITDFLGAYIREHYDIPDRRGEAAYDNWTRDHAVYTEQKNEALRAEEDLYRYLMLLERDGLDVVLYVNDTALYRDRIAAELFKELGVQAEGDEPLVLLRDGGARAARLKSLPKAGETLHTCAGTLTGGEGITLDGIALPAAGEASLRAVVLRGGEMVDCADFSFVYDAQRGVVSQYGVSRAD